MKSTPPEPGSPLEWWEEQQLAMLEAAARRHGLDISADLRRFRTNPDEWRAFKAQYREKHPEVWGDKPTH